MALLSRIAPRRQFQSRIGGIGNISVLHGGGRVGGFDTGPGNVLMDG